MLNREAARVNLGCFYTSTHKHTEHLLCQQQLNAGFSSSQIICVLLSKPQLLFKLNSSPNFS